MTRRSARWKSLLGKKAALVGVGVVKGEVRVDSDLAGGVVESHDLDAIDDGGGVVKEVGDGEAVLLVVADAPVLVLVRDDWVRIAACFHYLVGSRFKSDSLIRAL
ncbi:hypothetical protein NL676_008014 [Syzygium grande]|nr:hypothetical protein NL676_008014 [Syzygium grande]